MTSEELKVKIVVDTSELKKKVSQAKKEIQGINDATTKGIKGATSGATASIEELRDTMEQMRNLDIASFVVNQFDKVKDSVDTTRKAIKTTMQSAGSWAKQAGREILGAFDFKNFDVGDEGLTGYLDSMRVAAREAATSVRQATSKIGEAFRTMSQTIANTLGPIITKVALFAAAVAAAANVVNTFQTASQLKQMNAEAQKIGLSVNAYQEWAYVLEKVGVSADKLADFVKTLSDEQVAVREGSEETIRAFNELGLSAEQVMNMSQSALLSETVSRLQNVSNEVERTSLAYQIFGEDAAELANVLRLTNQETSEMAATVHLLGNTISGGLLTKSTALSSAILNLRMAWQGLTNTLAELFMPIITKIVEWLTKAIVVVNLFLKTVFNLDIAPAMSDLGSAVGGVGAYTEGLEGATGAAEGATEAIEKLKKVTMGFDELNIVTNPNTAATGSDSGSGGSGGGTSGGAFGSVVDTTKSVFTEAQKQIEEFQEKVKAFLEKWDTQIKIIAGSLGALSIANLLKQLGEALGLSDKFITSMGTIKKLATTAITMTLQYSLTNEFMDSFIDGEGIKNYIAGLITSALGTAVLYATWGTAGLMIGLGVTAVASLQAVLDNGGITDVESLTVALTGLASALGAVTAAVKVFNLGSILGDIGAFFTLLREGNSLTSVLAAAFPGLATAFTTLGTAASSALSAIGGIFGLTGGAAIAAGAAVVAAAVSGVVGVVVFLKENWEAVTKAVKDFFDENIAPKLDAIKESWNNIKTALSGVRDALLNALPPEFKEALESVGEEIGKVVQAVKDWFASIEWLEAIGAAFEFVGGVIVSVIMGVILGAFNGLMSAIEGIVKFIEGFVLQITGFIEIIVGLFTGDLDKAREGVDKILDGIKKSWEGLYDATIGLVVELVKGVIDWFTNLWDELVGHSIVPDMIEDIIDWFVSLPGAIFSKVEEFVNGIVTRFKEMWTNVKTAGEEKLSEIRTSIMNAWNNIKSYWNENIAPKFTLSYWQNKFDTMRSAIKEKLGAVRTQVMNSWNAIKSYWNENIAPKFTLSYWKGKLDTIRAAASEKFDAVRKTCMNVWNNIKSWFSSNVSSKFTMSYWKGKFDTIKEGARSAFNGVISVVERAVNGIISKINTLSWKIPDWVPKFGGDTFGFSLKSISIPRLAEGGIATSSTLANIGENGREAVLPLDNNTGWMDILADKIAARQQSPSKIVLKVGEKELGWATINSINQITKQTGGLQLAL